MKHFKWNHKRVYRIYRELELNLRIKPKKRFIREKPDALAMPSAINQCCKFTYEQALNVILTLKTNLMNKGEASPLFGNEHEHGLSGILGNIEQTFDGELLYPTVEEKAANSILRYQRSPFYRWE